MKPARNRDHRVHVDNAKYTFVSSGDRSAINVLRYGEPWIEAVPGANAIHSMMCALDAARLVIAAALVCAREGTAPPEIMEALDRHEHLVDDTHGPSAWTTQEQ